MSSIKAKYAENLLSDKNCNNCRKNSYCKKNNKEKYNTCVKWEIKLDFDPSDLFKIIRMSYPSSIKSDLFEEFAMETKDLSFPYINYQYSDSKDKDEKIRDEFNNLSKENTDYKNVLEEQIKYLESIGGSDKKRK